MQIAIELIVILAIIFLLMTWAIWFRVTRWIAKRRYKKEYDQGKHREGESKLGGGVQKPSEPNVNISGQGELISRELLPTAIVDEPGENIKLTGTSSKGNGKTFNLFRRRK